MLREQSGNCGEVVRLFAVVVAKRPMMRILRSAGVAEAVPEGRGPENKQSIQSQSAMGLYIMR